MTRRLFHLAEPLEWQRFLDGGREEWTPASLASEGFVHLSFAEQLAGTLAAHFAERHTLVLFELDAARLGDALRLERSRAGLFFPHLYRAPRRSELVGWWRLARASGWSLPHLGHERAADDPPAEALRASDARQSP